MNFQDKLNNVIPGGAHTYSRGFDQFPENAPHILKKGKGAYVWCHDDKTYLDYGMGLRSVTIGYADPRVNNAAINEIMLGNNLTRASLTELKAAELFTSLIPGADMVKFAKNGSNVTSAAVKLARSFNGRKYVCVPRQHPFFTYDDWFIGTTQMSRGIPTENKSLTLLFDYNDIASLRSLFDKYPNEIAAVMLEPATTITPCAGECQILGENSPCGNCPNADKNFLQKVHKLCKENGSIFILDEMITGFRWSLKGAAHYFGVIPDLMTFGKGMANGFSLAAVAGRREIMELGSINKPGLERTFLLSSTHGGEMSSLGAFMEVVKIYQEQNVCGHLWKYGKALREGLIAISEELSISKYFSLSGPDINLNYVAKDSSGNDSAQFRTLFSQEMINEGVLMPWIAVSLSHGDSELDQTLSAARKALKVYSKALNSNVENFLRGKEVKPVFRKHN
jgi:glutamate-1-semialdehyde 2,1-aminomutase